MVQLIGGKTCVSGVIRAKLFSRVRKKKVVCDGKAAALNTHASLADTECTGALNRLCPLSHEVKMWKTTGLCVVIFTFALGTLGK